MWINRLLYMGLLDLFNKNKVVPRATLFKYGIPQSLDFHSELQKDNSVVITCEELPGFITVAKNDKNFPGAVSEAVLCYFDVPNEEGNILEGKLINRNFTFVARKEKTKQLA